MNDMTVVIVAGCFFIGLILGRVAFALFDGIRMDKIIKQQEADRENARIKAQSVVFGDTSSSFLISSTKYFFDELAKKQVQRSADD